MRYNWLFHALVPPPGGVRPRNTEGSALDELEMGRNAWAKQMLIDGDASTFPSLTTHPSHGGNLAPEQEVAQIGICRKLCCATCSVQARAM